MENLQIALMLMLVGMVTVFLILLLVILLGKYLILFVNKYAPEQEIAKASKSSSHHQHLSPILNSVISETVKIITNGKGSVKKVEKI